MASIKTQDVKNFLTKLNYKVIVSKIDNGCCVEYPWSGINTYLIGSNGFVLCNEKNQNFIYTMPEYAIRIGIITQIGVNCKKNKYALKMIEYKIGDNLVKNLFKILNTSEDIREIRLRKVFKTGIEFSFAKFVDNLAAENDVLDGYMALRQIWENQ